MCKRYSFVVSKDRIYEEFGNLHIDPSFKMSYNIAPGNKAAVICSDDPKRIEYIEWGLIPFWSKDGINHGNLINARKEKINSSPSYRMPIRKRRAICIADSFYIWKDNIPYRVFNRSGNLLIFGAVWDVWKGVKGMKKSFSIITLPANGNLISLNDRMPFILEKDQVGKWLIEKDLKEVSNMIQVENKFQLQYYRISDKIQSTTYNGMDLHTAIPYVPTLFDV